jgi:hypothetical protein
MFSQDKYVLRCLIPAVSLIYATIRIKSVNTKIFTLANLKQLHVSAVQGSQYQAVCSEIQTRKLYSCSYTSKSDKIWLRSCPYVKYSKTPLLETIFTMAFTVLYVLQKCFPYLTSTNTSRTNEISAIVFFFFFIYLFIYYFHMYSYGYTRYNIVFTFLKQTASWWLPYTAETCSCCRFAIIKICVLMAFILIVA